VDTQILDVACSSIKMDESEKERDSVDGAGEEGEEGVGEGCGVIGENFFRGVTDEKFEKKYRE